MKAEQVIRDLNILGKLIKNALKKQGIVYRTNEWKLIKYIVPNLWPFQFQKLDIPFEETDAQVAHGAIVAWFRKGVLGMPKNQLGFAINFGRIYSNTLFEGVDDPGTFAQTLAKIFFEHDLYLPYEEYKKLQGPIKNEESPYDKIAAVLQNWIEGDTYAKTSKWGRRLEDLKAFMPPEALTLSSNTLYRGIRVKKQAFDKLLTRGKPLILKNRRYSSWTPEIKLAKHFAERSSNDEVGVVFRRTFSSDEIVVNVMKLQHILDMQELEEAFGRKRWPEIIIKNINNDYRFTLKDIYAYFDPQTKKWIKP